MKCGADLIFFHTNFQPQFHPFRVKIFQNPFLVDPHYEYKHLSQFHVSTISGYGCACVLPQSVSTCPFIYIDIKIKRVLTYEIWQNLKIIHLWLYSKLKN